MQSTQQKQADFSQLVPIVLRRKWLIIICIIGSMIPIIYFNKTSKPVYEAVTKIVCEESRSTIPDFSIAQARLTRSFIENQIQEIFSWSLANGIVRILSDSVLKSFRLPEQLTSLADQEDFYTSAVQKSISANTITNSDVIKISAQAYSAKAAYMIANTAAEVLKQRNLNARLGEILNVRQTIEDQLIDFKQRVEKTEKALREYKERNNVTFLDQESQELFRRITEAEIQYNRVKTSQDATEKRFKFIKNKLAQERKDLVPSITETTSPWAQRLKQNLIDLEVQYTTLKVQDYDDNHPQMKKLKSQIEETKKNLITETLKIAQGGDITDPLSQIQRSLEEAASLEVELHTFEAQEKALKKVLNSYNNILKSVPEKELELGRLLRDKNVADNIYIMLLQQREQAKITEAEKTGNIRIIDPARIPINPVKPRKILNLIIGFIVGISLGAVLAFVLESLDKSIKTTEEAEEYLNLPVFSTIPRIKSRSNEKLKSRQHQNLHNGTSALTSKLIAGRSPKSPAAEAFRNLRTSIGFMASSSSIKTIMITSSSPSEGKSLIAANLSISSAQVGFKTLLVDLDLRKPVQHDLFGKEKEPGIMDIILSLNEYKDFEHVDVSNNNSSNTIKLIQEINTPFNKSKNQIEMGDLHLLTCGKIPPNPSEILSSNIFRILLDSLKKSYDVIIVDAPPVLAVTDAAIIAKIVDGIIMVIRAGKSTQKEISRSKILLERAKGNIIGSVLNDINGVSSYGYYYESKYFDKDNEKVE